MSYITSVHINTNRTNPFPYDVPSIRFADNITFPTAVSFIVGDNGTGKSTFLETIAFRLQLPMIDGSNYSKTGFEAAKILAPYIEMQWGMERSVGFFFRAEDFGSYVNSTDREDYRLRNSLKDLEGEIPENVFKQMRDSANHQLHHVRKNFGQELQSFSHGEAYLQIMKEKINQRGIYLLDEPEAALSPARLLSLLYFIQEHLASFNSQFIIATHSPILMAFPGATLYEVTEAYFEMTDLEEIEHFSLTKSFLNNPQAFLRHL